MTYRQLRDRAVKPYESLRFLFVAILLTISLLLHTNASARLWTPVSRAFDSRVSALDSMLRMDSMDGERALALVEGLRRSREALSKGAAQFQTGYWKAERLYYEGCAPEEVIESLESLGTVDSVRMPYEWFRINYLRLKVYLYRDKDYKEAYCRMMPLLEHTRRMGYRAEEARILANQGLLFYMIGDPAESMRYFGMAREAFTGLGTASDSLRNELNLCNALSDLGRREETVRRLRSIEREPEVRKQMELHCNVLLSLYMFTGMEMYAREAYKEAVQTGNDVLVMKSLGNLSGIYMKAGNEKLALESRKKVMSFFSRRDDPDVMEALRGIVEIYSGSGPRDSTLKYMSLLIAAQDTFSKAETLREVGKMKAQNEIRAVNAAITLAEARTSLERRKGWIITTIALSLLVTAGMGVVYMRRRNITEQKLKKLENESLTVSLRNERLLNERKQLEIDGRNRELASKALMLMKKNGLLNDLLSMIAEMRDKKALPASQCRAFESKIKQQLNANDDWNDFTLHFERVHPDFFNALKESYPQLTDKDLKLCAYLRLGLSTKQIAQMTSVLPESVNTARYRIRRKMGLAGDSLLEDVIRNIYPVSDVVSDADA